MGVYDKDLTPIPPITAASAPAREALASSGASATRPRDQSQASYLKEAGDPFLAVVEP